MTVIKICKAHLAIFNIKYQNSNHKQNNLNINYFLMIQCFNA